MSKTKENKKINVIVELTDGCEQRFTEAVMKIYERRLRQQNNKETSSDISA